MVGEGFLVGLYHRVRPLPCHAWPNRHRRAHAPPRFDIDQDCTGIPLGDIWSDIGCMQYLLSGSFPTHATAEEHRRIRRRSTKYCWSDCALFKILSVEERKIARQPREQLCLIQKAHEAPGILGCVGRFKWWPACTGGQGYTGA